MTEKVCIVCLVAKSVAEFYGSTRNKTGTANTCKECRSKQSAVWRRRNRPRHSQNGKKYLIAHPEVRRNALVSWHRKNPLAKAAHMIVRIALDAGILIKALRCQRCPTEGPLHAHHEDYRRPLDVEWLCALCHGKVRRRVEEEDEVDAVEMRVGM